MQIINRKKGKLKLKIKFSLAAALFEDILTDKLRMTVVLHKFKLQIRQVCIKAKLNDKQQTRFQ